MTISISDKSKALLMLQTRLDDANHQVQAELENHYQQLNRLRQAIVDRDSVEFTMGQLIKAIARGPYG